MSLNLQQVSDLYDTLDLTAGEAMKLFRVSHPDAVIRSMNKVRTKGIEGWRVVWEDPTADLQRQFIEACQTDHSPRVKDQWGRIHVLADFKTTVCGLKKQDSWITAPSDGLHCVEGCR